MEKREQKLSEGYDFIEESTSFDAYPVEFQKADEVVIVESEGEKSPYKILGRVRGVFAPIGEFSRNKRIYSENLWPTVLENEEFSTRLKRRGILGCIGHEDKRVDDKDLRDGKVSHVISKLEIRKNDKGKPYLYGEYDILDTPAGRMLEALHEGGVDLYVSSRGAGKLHPVPGQNYSMVLPESYYVDCFDVVLRPGFLQARPVFEQVTESVNENVEVPKLSYKKEEPKSEVEQLREQVEKLATVVEKLVDSVYEEDTEDDNVEKVSEDKQASLITTMTLLLNSGINEEVVSQTLDILIDSLKK